MHSSGGAGYVLISPGHKCKKRATVTVGKCEDADNEEEKDEATEAAPEVVLQARVTPATNTNTLSMQHRHESTQTRRCYDFLLAFSTVTLALKPSAHLT